ncbi:LptM family lipoprotein [Rummeliibacillus pycnus]|uniref:LptM family lipoprotein n=1 Tax=Rummeliibacillus pycnus TaxID=101070 RepID=UPI001B808B43|nr:hypothetical protein [Rummeliibacillus pycnus]
MKKILSLSAVVLLSVGLAACGQEKPEDAVNGFLTSFQKGDLEKAGTYIAGGMDKVNLSNDDNGFSEKIYKPIGESYEFEKPKEKSIKGDNAKVDVKITSVDVGTAFTNSITKVMPMAFATAFEESDKSQKAIQNMMEKEVVKNISSKKADMSTRTVTLNLKKNKDGKYKIVADDNLEEAIFANLKNVQDAFGDNTNSDNAADQPKKDVQVLSTIAKNKSFDVNPIKLNIEEVSFKKASNVPQDEQDSISSTSGKDVGSEFNYIYIKYNAENTSDKDFIFSGINKVVLFTDGKQETIDNSMGGDFIDYDEDNDGEYYGKVKKQGEVGLVIKTDPSKVDKVRLVIGHSMDSETYDLGRDDQKVEYTIKK